MAETVKSEGIRFTDEQIEAIEARGADVLVSAAAGSGKTAVLAERIVRLVSGEEDRTDIDRILVVTFTRAAAASMREKIAGALSKRISADPGDPRLRRQELLLPHAKIMTIDAFCQYILRNNFETAGIDPSFTICDDGEGKLISAEAMEEILEEAYARGDAGFLHCAEAFSKGADDSALENEIRKLSRFAESMPWPELWLGEQLEECERTAELTAGEFAAAGWVEGIVSIIKKETGCCIDMLEDALKICSQAGGPNMYYDTIMNDIEKLAAICTAGDYWELRDAAVGSGELFGRLPSKKDESVFPELREKVQGIRNEAKAVISKNIKRYLKQTPDEIISTEKHSAFLTAALIRLVMSYRERLDRKKREKNVIDFSDMEHLALKVLTVTPDRNLHSTIPEPSDTARAYSEYFSYIMIDEYQDSNRVQELLLGAIAKRDPGQKNRFMVGDVKQSIYRFRLARPEIFTEKYRSFKKDGPDERRIDLHRNFRSRKEILLLTNRVFERIMLSDVGGVDYDADAALVYGASYTEEEGDGDHIPELLLCSREADDSDAAGDPGEDSEGGEADQTVPEDEAVPELSTGDAASLTPEQKEACLVASRIASLVGSEMITGKDGKKRTVRYGDIVILMRATSGVDEIYRDILTEKGIPVYTESKAGYFGAREVRILLDLLAVLENPFRDIPLADVMRSVIGGFSDEELAAVRLCDMAGGHSFFEAVTACAGGRGHSPAELTEKCSEFIRRLDIWRECSERLSVGKLLDYILDETGYSEKISAMPGGTRRRANVQLLSLRAQEFEKTGGQGLSSFCARIEQYGRAEVDFGEANVLSEDADVVRIMSIHKSKGLEFPVVFLSGLSRQFNRGDERAAILTDDDLGIGGTAVDLENRIRRSSLRRLAVADRLHSESTGEEFRVLYVGMTRAMEKLIMTACVKRDKIDELLKSREELKQRDETGEEDVIPVSYLRRVRATSYFSLLSEALKDIEGPVRISFVDDSMLEIPFSEKISAEKDRKKALTDMINGVDIDCYLKAEIARNTDFTYAHRNLENMMVKTTVTELKEKLLEDEGGYPGTEELFRSTETFEIVPFFTEEKKKLTGAERGTAYHKIMELIDAEIMGLEQLSNPDYISENAAETAKWMKKMAGECRMPESYAEAVKPRDIISFLTSELGGRLARAFRDGALYRERQFMMGIDAARVDPSYPAGETILLQGVIDAYFIEDGGIILLDYKTDRVFRDPAELAEKYRVQLELYAETLERLTGMPVREKWIYSFDRAAAVRL